MSRYLALILSILIITTAFLYAISNDSDGWRKQTLADGSDEYEITFPPGGGKNLSAELTFRKGVEVISASINFTPLADPFGNYPMNVTIDIGDNVRPEWNFIGQGYGHWGKQTMFSDETLAKTFSFSSADNASMTVRLPKDCQVTSATLEIEGSDIDRNFGLGISRTSGTGTNPWAYTSESNTNRPRLEINASSGDYLIQPSGVVGKDTRVSSQAPNSNYGAQAWMMGGGGTVHSFAWYDLSSIPNDATIYNATYSVFHAFTDVNGDEYSIYRVLDDWDEMVITYNNMPPVDPTVHASLVFPTGTNAWRSWNITTLVPLWLGYDYPTNVTLDIGADTTKEFTHHGDFNTVNITPDLSTYLNTYLLTAQPTLTDTYGNELVDVPINISTDQRGIIDLRNLSFEYDMTVTIDEDSTISLVDELNDLIPPASLGNVTISIAVSTLSAGIIKIHDIDILYNGYPRLNKTLTMFSLDEDTKESHLVNLSHYFLDDFVGSTELTYELESNSLPQIVLWSIKDGHWLSVDASTNEYNDNWYGMVELVVSATDDIDLPVESNTFIINVTSVNDEPTTGGETIPDITLLEGDNSSAIDLVSTDYFHDIEDDALYFDFVWDPLDQAPELVSNVTQDYDEIDKTFSVGAKGDWFGSGTLRIYCDDDDESDHNENPYQDILVTVQNLNDDPPVWKSMLDLEIHEDSSVDNWIDLDVMVTDIDSNIADIKFTVDENTNGTSIGVDIDAQHYLDIATLEKDFDGETTVTLRATDESGNFADTSFNITVIPSNDPPLVTLEFPPNGTIIVSQSIELRWNSTDPETPLEELSYNVFLGTGGGFEQVATGINERTYLVDGLEKDATYTWWVIPYDGSVDGICTSGKYEFTVNISLGSTSTLLTPIHGAVFNTPDVTLTWTGKTQPGLSISYDVYLDEGNVEPTTKIADRITGTSLVLSDLQDDTTYSWTVIPSDSRGFGFCTDGVWNFTIDSTRLLYGVEISIDSSEVVLYQGDYTSVIVEITNTGENVDTIVPYLDARVLSSTVTLESDGVELEHAPRESKSLALDILIPDNTPPMVYTVTVKATSFGGGDTVSQDITVEVKQMKTDGGDDDAFGLSNPLFLLFIIIILVVIILVVIVMRQRKWVMEEEARRQAEEKQRKEEALRLARALKAVRGSVLRPSGEATLLPPPGVPGAAVPQIARPTQPEMLQLPQVSSIPQQQPPPGPVAAPPPHVGPPPFPSGPAARPPPPPPQPPDALPSPASPSTPPGQPQVQSPETASPEETVAPDASSKEGPAGEGATEDKKDDISYTLPGD